MNGIGEPCYVEVTKEYNGLCDYAQKITACFGVNEAPGVLLLEMLPFPGLNTLGKLCGSGLSKEAQQPSINKPGTSVKRMSIIEDEEISEVLYLIPKQTLLQHMNHLNPNHDYLCEELTGLPAGL
ncbi:hypothetical protein XELAEV_18036647mg, partial [Xenopus laevis]